MSTHNIKNISKIGEFSSYLGHCYYKWQTNITAISEKKVPNCYASIVTFFIGINFFIQHQTEKTKQTPSLPLNLGLTMLKRNRSITNTTVNNLCLQITCEKRPPFYKGYFIYYSANHVYCRRPGPGHLLN